MNELERAIQEVERRTKIKTRIKARPRDQQLFRDSVKTWCEVLKWPDEVANLELYVQRLHHRHLGIVAARIGSVFWERKLLSERWREIKPVARTTLAMFIKGFLADDAGYINVTEEAMLMMEIRDYLLIALAVAAAGYAAYCFKDKPSLQEPRTSSPVAEPAGKVLVLVINAGRESVIDALRAGRGSAWQGDQLYEATQALWVGSAAEFEHSGLAQWFGTERAVPKPSEYDVHLIRLDIATDDAGLHRNANQLDRLDAFRRFQATGFKATVSPRLPSNAYGTTDVYSR
jgi:hypothetical protein